MPQPGITYSCKAARQTLQPGRGYYVNTADFVAFILFHPDTAVQYNTIQYNIRLFEMTERSSTRGNNTKNRRRHDVIKPR